FLNWREHKAGGAGQGQGPAPSAREAERAVTATDRPAPELGARVRDDLALVWEAVDNAGGDGAKLRDALAPLELATRYFIGGLAAAGIDVSQAHDPPLEADPHAPIVRAARAASGAD